MLQPFPLANNLMRENDAPLTAAIDHYTRPSEWQCPKGTYSDTASERGRCRRRHPCSSPDDQVRCMALEATAEGGPGP
jgi:hypothetical protein